MSMTEGVPVIQNKETDAESTNPHQDRVEIAKSLFGILPKDADLEDVIALLEKE